MVKKTLVSKISTMMENAISNFYLNHGFSKAFPSFHGKNKTIVFCRFSPKKNHPLTMDLRRPPGRCPPRTWRPRTWRTWPRLRWPPTRPRPQGAELSQDFGVISWNFAPLLFFFLMSWFFFRFFGFPSDLCFVGEVCVSKLECGTIFRGKFQWSLKWDVHDFWMDANGFSMIFIIHQLISTGESVCVCVAQVVFQLWDNIRSLI